MGREVGRVLVPPEQDCSVCLKTQREPPKLGAANSTVISSVARASWTGPSTQLGLVSKERMNERMNECLLTDTTAQEGGHLKELCDNRWSCDLNGNNTRLLDIKVCF